MSAAPLPVQDYLSYLEAYLKGDLDKFHNLCAQAEVQEAQFPSLSGEAPYTQSAAPAGKTTSSTATIQSTAAPGQPSPAPNLPQIFRSTIPHVLALFATMDLVGFLWSSRTKPIKTFKNLKDFLKRTSIDKVPQEALISIYRNGMVHGYFPKERLAISYHTLNPTGQLFLKHNGNIVLNVNELERLVLSRLSAIQPSEFPGMQKQYKILETFYSKDCGPIISRLSSLI